jgi:cell division protease FtsH
MMEKLNINRVPSKRKDRIKLLDSALVQLKREFVGLDDIIDQLGASVYAWYVTPEIITRPTIVSIWGMTGTGKTSVVKRLISLLNLDDVRISFDCGECRDNNKSISTDIMDTFGKSEESDSGDRFSGSNSLVFMFDEFQYARTINESGEEDVAPSLRPIWSILDSGIIDINDYNYDFSSLCDFIDELVDTSKSLPHIIIKDNHIESPDDVSAFLNIMFFHYDMGPSIKTDNTEDQNKPLEVLTSRYLRTIIRRLNNKSDALGSRVAKELLSGEYTIGQLAERLEDIKKLAASSRKLDCSKSLVFILGNLDEAYKDSSDISPDIDADLFYDITSRVTTTDIKEALKERYRPEQIGRLGNNIIKYPTLSKDSFKKIIDLEIGRILDRFSEVDKIKVVFEQSMKDLLYSESVYPTQGVRPVLSSIDTLITPYLSKVVEHKGRSKSVSIGVVGGVRDFRLPSVDIRLKFDKAEEVIVEQKLELGKERCPENRKKRFICAVHEIGHAVMYSWCKGEVPDNIVSVSTDHGGFCSTYDRRFAGEIDCRRDVLDEVRISLGGYQAERVIYNNPDMWLLGSSSDIRSLWKELSSAVMDCGFDLPLPLSHRDVEQNGSISNGLDCKDVMVTNKSTGDGRILELIKEGMDYVWSVLSDEKELIKKAAIKLGEQGSMSGQEFSDFIRQYGNKLTLDKMKEVYNERDPEYYFKELV